MAKADFTFRIRIDGDKAVIEATQATRKLRGEIDKTTQSQNKANKSATSHQRTQERGVYQTSNNARNFSKLSQTIGSGDNGLVGAYATLAANTFAVTAAFVALQKSTESLKIMAGLEAQSARLGTTLSLTASRIRDVTNSAVSMSQAFSSTAQLTAAGFDSGQIERLAAVAKDASGALGRDLVDGMDRLTRGVTKLEPELLDELGIMTKLDEATRKYAVENNKAAEALTSTEKRQAFLNAVLDEGERKFGGTGDAVDKYASFTRLAATATDTFVTVVGTLATVLAPIAELFASNQLFVAGAVIAYAGSIRKDLIPALAGVSAAQTKVLEEENELLKKRTKKFNNNFVNKGAEGRSLTGFVSKETKLAFSKFNAEAQSGAISIDTYKRTISTLDEQMLNYKGTIESTLSTQREITKAQKNLTGADIALKKVKDLRTNQLALNVSLAEHETLTAASNASFGNFRQTLAKIVKGTREHYIALRNQALYTDSATVSTSRLKIAMSGLGRVTSSAAVGAKAFGIAIINMLPVIGQILIGLTLLYEGFMAVVEYFRDASYSEYLKVMEEVNTINEAAAEKIKALADTQEKAVSSYSAQLDAIRLMGNGVAELTDSYVRLAKAKEKSETNSVDEIIAGVTSNPLALSDIQNKTESAALKRLTSDPSNSGIRFSNETDFQTMVAGLEAVSNTYSLVNQKNKNFIDTQLAGIDVSASYEDQYKALAKILEVVGANFKETAASVENLSETFKNLEEATTQFIQAATDSTPVDALARNISAVNSAISQYSIELERGTISGEEFGKSLATLGTQTRNLLGDSITEVISLDTVTAEIASLKSLGDEISKGQKDRLTDLQREATILATSIGPAIQENLQKREAEVRVLQQSFRLLKSQLDIENARFKVTQELFQKGAEGYLAREAHEEKIRAAQVSQLDMQSNILKIMQTQAEITLLNLTNRKIQLEFELFILKVMGEQGLELLRNGQRQDAISRLAGQAMEDALAKIDKEGEGSITTMNALQAELSNVELSITNANVAMQDLGDAISSLEAQKAAILAENLTEAQKAAGALVAEFEVAKEFFNDLDNYARSMLNLNRTVATYNRLLKIGNNETLESTIQILETYEDTIDSLRSQTAIQQLSLEKERARLIATRDSGIQGAEQQAAAERTLSINEKNLANSYDILDLATREAEATARLELLRLSIFETTKEGIEWQVQALSYTQKEADLAERIAKNRASISDSQRDRARIASGLPTTEQSAANDAVRSATEAFRAAKVRAEIQLSVIDAEYALMEAQKIALEQELIARRSILEASGADPAYLAPLTRAIDTLSEVNITNLRDLAREGIISGVTASAEELATAVAKANPPSQIQGALGAFLARRRDEDERGSVTAEAMAALSEPLVVSNRIELAKTRESGIKAMEKVEESTLQVEAALTPPIVEINGNIRAIRDILEGRGTGTVGPTVDPLKGAGTITSRFGADRGSHKHGGDDIAAPTGTPVYASRDGIVSFSANTNDAFGQLIKIADGSIEDFFGHLSVRLVEEGQRVAAGQLIGRVGSTGRSTGPHLHFETRVNGVAVDPKLGPRGAITLPIEIQTARQQDTTAVARPPSTEEITARKDQFGANKPSPFVGLLGTVEALDAGLPTLVSMNDEMVIFTDIARTLGQLNSFDKLIAGIKRFREEFALNTQPLREFAETMGPDGELVIAMIGGVDNILTSFEAVVTSVKTGENVLLTSLAAASAVISSISSIMQASSDARVRGIDAEIAAEQKRDGQSAASQQKIAALEKKKEQVQRKQFNLNKKMMMAQAIIATAAGIAQALTLGPIVGPIMAAIIGAMGLAQVAIIAGTSFQGGSSASAANTSVPKLTIGKVGSSANLEKSNPNAGGEIGYLRGAQGTGTNASNFRTVGSSYGGMTNRGYGHRSFLVGEKGPETVETDEPMNVKPYSGTNSGSGDTYVIQATDASSFEEMLRKNPAPIIEGIQKVANSNGINFMRDVDTRSFGGTKR